VVSNAKYSLKIGVRRKWGEKVALKPDTGHLVLPQLKNGGTHENKKMAQMNFNFNNKALQRVIKLFYCCVNGIFMFDNCAVATCLYLCVA
jgi:hypothetical protein